MWLQNNLFYLVCIAFSPHRPLGQLLEACQEKVRHTQNGGKFRTEELLQLVCELAVHPDTYEALSEMYDCFAPIPPNYMSDDEIEGKN